jgi:hypothetical protein
MSLQRWSIFIWRHNDMYKDQLLVWLKDQGLDYTISGNEIKFKCPSGSHEDHNPSFSANTITGACFCFSCSYSTHLGKLLDIKRDADSVRLSKYLALDRMWEGQVTPTEPPPPIVMPPIDFMVEESIRGLPRGLVIELGIYYCTIGRYAGRLILPIKDKYGNILGFDARIYEHPARPEAIPQVPNAKYLRPSGMSTADCLYPLDYLWNHRNDLDLSVVVLTEGVFDAISYIALGVPAVCNFGLGAPSADKAGHLLSLGVQSIANGWDSDAPAVRAWQGTETKQGVKEVWRQYMPLAHQHPLTKKIKEKGYKDANDYLTDFTVA